MRSPIDHKTCIVNSARPRIAASWTEFLIEVESALYELNLHGRAYMVLNVDRPDDPFVQYIVDAEGKAHGEATGTLRHHDHRHRLQPHQELVLGRLGWKSFADEMEGWRPDGADRHLIWWRESDPRWILPEPLFAELLVRTLVEAYEVASPADVHWRFGNMPHDGPGTRAGDVEASGLAA